MSPTQISGVLPTDDPTRPTSSLDVRHSDASSPDIVKILIAMVVLLAIIILLLLGLVVRIKWGRALLNLIKYGNITSPTRSPAFAEIVTPYTVTSPIHPPAPIDEDKVTPYTFRFPTSAHGGEITPPSPIYSTLVKDHLSMQNEPSPSVSRSPKQSSDHTVVRTGVILPLNLIHGVTRMLANRSPHKHTPRHFVYLEMLTGTALYHVVEKERHTRGDGLAMESL
ncbi:hypothetical protein NLI96_g9379 [Meripilus lineatus]|uniref:Uncharacterized protein n=1 Tax=Meripilus lineatus TaxID=2056292 RepID=A0AAD5V074_9APHY|nr:hypothetical protein NLI96_g9379 [Physisporinus lineatus]